MLVSSSEGLAREGLFAAILLRADMIAACVDRRRDVVGEVRILSR